MSYLKASVVVPAYNEEDYLGKALASLKNQSIEPFEIIVVDNNSTDKTVEIAKSYNVKIIKEHTQGLSYARDKGFDEAKGDILLRLDSDSVAPTDWVERITQEFEKDTELSTFSGSAVLIHPIFNFLFDFFCFYINDIFGYNSMLGPNFALRKTAWEKIRGTTCDDNHKFHEDLDIAIHSQQLGTYRRKLNLRVLTSNRRTAHPKSLISIYTYYHVKWRNTVFDKKHRKLSRRWWMRVL